MIERGKTNSVVRILAMGLTQGEKRFMEKHYAEGSWEIIYSNNDLEMWDHADHEKYDLCLIGQTEDSQDLNYATWLLKDIVKPSQIVVIADQCAKQERKQLRKHRIRFILNRPLNPNSLSGAIENALIYNKPWFIRVYHFLKK